MVLAEQEDYTGQDGPTHPDVTTVLRYLREVSCMHGTT